MKRMVKRRKRIELPKKIGYRDGGEGMIKWCNDYIFVPIYPEGSDVAVWYSIGNLPSEPNPETGKSYKSIWENQHRILKEALRMENKRFVYSNIVFCWQRGEGKSLIACLIQLWKFFNWPRQQIMLGANSKDQIKFVHFDIMKDIILFSPKLLRIVGGKKNLQEKEIRIKDAKGNVRSLIRSISSFTGIVSNITGYTFSEIFDMKNPKFYTQLDGSIRNIPNALGVIDSTVSSKTHVLYTLYENARKGKTKKVYFSYRCSRHGDLADYWNPYMTETQLSDYKAKFPFGDFERYFLNLWSAGIQRIFTDEMIEGTKMIGADGELLNQSKMHQLLKEKNHLIEVVKKVEEKGFEDGVLETEEKITKLYNRFKPVNSIYSLKDKFSNIQMATMEDLMELGNLFDTDWSILTGADFGDPLAVRGLARSVITVMAKGLPHSRSRPFTILTDIAPKYIYFMLHVALIDNHSADTAKEILEEIHDEFDGIDTFCGERYRLENFENWCKDRDIGFESVYPNYERQKEAFKELLLAVKEGRWKCPSLAIEGSKKEDIRDEEMEVFDHNMKENEKSGWFGSGEKLEKYGIQDDFVFSSAWTMYGGKALGVDDFRARNRSMFFGLSVPQKGLLGNYA
ncbi:MAG: hypothetical protein U9O65_08015 [Thermotogota bacterium]|nr:hypothetical protein [Thermotogota bacterium]